MTIQQLLRDKQMSRYRLSKLSEIPWAELADIYSGKIEIKTCSADILSRLSQALGISTDELLALETKYEEPLETTVSDGLNQTIKAYLRGKKEKVLYLDCLWDEVYGSINADLWAGLISEEQAEYLRGKYLDAGEEDADD